MGRILLFGGAIVAAGFFAVGVRAQNASTADVQVQLGDLFLADGRYADAQDAYGRAVDAADPATSIPRPFFETRYNGRIDWTINQKNSLYASYSSQANNSLNDQSDGTGDLTNGNYTTNHMQIANVTWNATSITCG